MTGRLEQHRSEWTLAGLVRAAFVAGISLGVGAGLGYLVAHEPAPGAGPAPVTSCPAGAAELALVAPLAPGAALLDFTVVEILAVRDGTLRVVCERGEARVLLDVALAAEDGPRPPALAGRYAVFYAPRGATSEDGSRLAAALAAIVAANEAVPTPSGMGPYPSTSVRR